MFSGSHQGCSLGLERLGLETFFGTSRLGRRLNVSVSSREFGKIERLGLVLVLRVQRLGLEDITSRSRNFSLVNMHAMRIYHEENNGSHPQETRCQVRDFTSWCFKLCTAVLIRFLEHLGLASRSRDVFLERLVSDLKVERLGLVSVLRVWKNGTSRSRLGLVT